MKQMIIFILIIIVIGLLLWFNRSDQHQSTLKKTPGILLSTSPSPILSTTPLISMPATATSQDGAISLSILSPVDGAVVNQPNLTVKGKTAPLASVYVNDLELNADSQGNFSTTIILIEGDNLIYFLAHDNVGDAVELEVTVTLETQ